MPDPDFEPIAWWQRPILWCWHVFVSMDLWLAKRENDIVLGLVLLLLFALIFMVLELSR